MRRLLLGYMLDRAAAPEGAALAAMLPRLERAVPATRKGAQIVRGLCADERWTARHLAGRVMGRLPDDAMSSDEAWGRLLALAADEHPMVREGAPYGLAALAARDAAMAARAEALLTDAGAPRSARRAVLRSIVALCAEPPTRPLGERLLRTAALADEGVNRGVGAVVLSRGIGARDPELARRIATEWATAPEPALRREADRALRVKLPVDAPAPVPLGATASRRASPHAAEAR
ncbi:MAG: hypothetical protein ACLGI5_02490 [Thermoleophilia bacterium]